MARLDTPKELKRILFLSCIAYGKQKIAITHSPIASKRRLLCESAVVKPAASLVSGSSPMYTMYGCSFKDIKIKKQLVIHMDRAGPDFSAV